MQATARDIMVSFGAYMERLPDNLLLEPVEFIFADHCRQADMCQALRRFAENTLSAPPNPVTAAALLECLDVDMSRHIADEEMDLFPHLRARAQKEDRFDEVLKLLDAEHDRDRELADAIITDMKAILQTGSLADPEEFRSNAKMFAEMHTSHLKWENTVVLALARKRLTLEDLQAMGQTMAARRGIAFPIP